jgi:hypothetical protein
MQMLEKGFLLIKEAKMLDFGSYSDFLDMLVALKKRMQIPLYIPFCFFVFS